MPLDCSTYYMRPSLRSLATHPHTGPMVLHTFGITYQPADHLTRSPAPLNELAAAPAAR